MVLPCKQAWHGLDELGICHHVAVILGLAMVTPLKSTAEARGKFGSFTGLAMLLEILDV